MDDVRDQVPFGTGRASKVFTTAVSRVLELPDYDSSIDNKQDHFLEKI